MKKLSAMVVAGAMSLWLTGCGGSPSASEFEARLKEQCNGMSEAQKVQEGLTDKNIASLVELYKKAPNDEMRQKMYDSAVKKAANAKK